MYKFLEYTSHEEEFFYEDRYKNTIYGETQNYSIALRKIGGISCYLILILLSLMNWIFNFQMFKTKWFTEFFEIIHYLLTQLQKCIRGYAWKFLGIRSKTFQAVLLVLSIWKLILDLWQFVKILKKKISEIYFVVGLVESSLNILN